MSIAGVGSHTGYYYGIGMQKQVTENEENFGKCLYEEGSEEMHDEGNKSKRIDTRELYEAMSNGSGFTELNASRQVEETTGVVTIAETEEEGQSVTCGMRAMLSENNDMHYTTTYTEEGMVCHREGQEDAVWEIQFENPEQYEKVAEFIDKFPSDWNLVFASREDFWKDFLDDKIDINSYEEYISGTGKQVPKGMVIEKSVVSLPSGVSFYMSEDTGEVDCIDDSNNLPGRQCLWSKFLSEEDFVRCKGLFEKEKGETTWEYKYGAYLSYEKFWDMYLNNELDLSKREDLDVLFKDED